MPEFEMTERDLLMAIANDVKDLKRSVEGNGQPGILDRLAIVETRVDERRDSKVAAGGGAVFGTAIGSAILVVLQKLGVLT